MLYEFRYSHEPAASVLMIQYHARPHIGLQYALKEREVQTDNTTEYGRVQVNSLTPTITPTTT